MGGSSGGCPAVWSISHHRGYCSRESMVQPPHPCGLSCVAPLLRRRPRPGLWAGTPVISFFHGSRRRLPWSPMQPGRARTRGLGVLRRIPRGRGGILSRFQFYSPKKDELSNLHPSRSTPLVPPLAMQAQKQCAYMTANDSKRLPTFQSVLKTEINNNKYNVKSKGGVESLENHSMVRVRLKKAKNSHRKLVKTDDIASTTS